MDTKEKEQTGTTIPNPHDVFTKEMLSYKQNAVDFFGGILPEPIKTNLKLRTAKLDTTCYTDEKLDQYFSDVVYTCAHRYGRGRAKLALLFEHKSFVPKFPHSQLLRYILNIWDHHTKQKKPRPVVLPILFYHGRRKKVKQQPLASYLSGVTEQYTKFIPSFEYVLVNLSEYPDELIIKTFGNNTAVKLWLFIQKHIFTPEKVLEILRNFTDDDRIFITTEKGLRVWETICRYLFKATSLSAEEITEAVTPLPQNAKETIMTTAEKLRKEGLEQGELKKSRDTASRMLEKGYPIEDICDITGLSRKEVEKLRQG